MALPKKPDSGVCFPPSGERKGGSSINPALSRPLLDLPCTSVELPGWKHLPENVKPENHSFTKIFCGGCGEALDVPAYCGNRFCSVCSTSRAERVRNRLQSLVAAAPLRPGYSLKMITLTLPNSVAPRAGVARLLRSFRKLRSRSAWRGRVSGGAFVVEVSGRPNAWHCHIHALVHAKYIPVRMLSRLWNSVSPGYIVDIRQVSVRSSVPYLTKYLSKASVPEWLQIEVSNALKGSRLFQPFGDWFRLLPPVKKRPLPCNSCGGSVWLTMFDVLHLGRTAREARPPPRPPVAVAQLSRIAIGLYAQAQRLTAARAQLSLT